MRTLFLALATTFFASSAMAETQILPDLSVNTEGVTTHAWDADTTTATINNIVSKLKKQFIFLKNDGKIEVNPVIVLDFKKNLNLVIKLTHEVKEVDAIREDSQADIEG